MTGAARRRDTRRSTVAESGVRGYETGSWYGIAAPAGTPRPIVDLLGREVAAAAKALEIVERLTLEAVIPIGSSPAQLAAHIRQELARIAEVFAAPDAKFE